MFTNSRTLPTIPIPIPTPDPEKKIKKQQANYSLTTDNWPSDPDSEKKINKRFGDQRVNRMFTDNGVSLLSK